MATKNPWSITVTINPKAGTVTARLRKKGRKTFHEVTDSTAALATERVKNMYLAAWCHEGIEVVDGGSSRF